MENKEIRTEDIRLELNNAQAIMDDNPVPGKSPGDLKSAGTSLEEYLAQFTGTEQKLYREYYEDEL